MSSCVLLASLFLLALAQGQLDFGPGGPLGPLNDIPGRGPGASIGGGGGGRGGGGGGGGGGGAPPAIIFPSLKGEGKAHSFKTQRGSENGAIPFGRYDDDNGLAGMLSEPMDDPARGGRSLSKWTTAQTDADLRDAQGGGGGDDHKTELKPFGMDSNCDCCESGVAESKCGGTVQPDGTCCFLDAPSRYCKPPRSCVYSGKGGGRDPGNAAGMGRLLTNFLLRRRRRR